MPGTAGSASLTAVASSLAEWMRRAKVTAPPGGRGASDRAASGRAAKKVPMRGIRRGVAGHIGDGWGTGGWAVRLAGAWTS
jgi:hypothetical protein